MGEGGERGGRRGGDARGSGSRTTGRGHLAVAQLAAGNWPRPTGRHAYVEVRRLEDEPSSRIRTFVFWTVTLLVSPQSSLTGGN